MTEELIGWTLTSLGEKRWFPFKNSEIERMSIQRMYPERIQLGEVSIVILKLKIAGRDELISIPVHFEKTRKEGFLASVTEDGEEIHMHDAAESGAIMNLMRSVILGKTGNLSMNGDGVDKVKAMLAENPSFRLLLVDQSNTSFVLNEKVICKYFRRPALPPSPDFEISSMISSAGGADIVPVPYCEMVTSFRDSENFSILAVQEFVKDAVDYWKLMGRYRERILNPGRGGENQTLFDIRKELTGLALMTARMHRVMDKFKRPGYEPEPYTKDDAIRYDQELENYLESAVRKLGDSNYLDSERKEKLINIISRLRGSNPFCTGYSDGLMKQKIHGDFHLGQVITSPRGPLVIDFEGEPMSTEESRSKKKLPAQDVAGMIRSIYYAFSTATEKTSRDGKIAMDHLKETSRTLFINAYFGEASDPAIAGKSRKEFSDLVLKFETLKVFYELNYELNNRPAMVAIPADDIIGMF